MSEDRSLEQHVLDLVDRTEIADRLHDYCRGLDAMDLELLCSVFTEDCVVDYGPEPGMQTIGRGTLAHGLDRMMFRWVRTSHHLSNVQIELLDRDHARSVSYVMAWHEFPDRQTTILYAQYHDTLRREVTGWRVQERRLVMTGGDANWDIPNHRLTRKGASLVSYSDTRD